VEGAAWWGSRIPAGWASRFNIFLREDVRDWDDGALGALLAEECAHWALEQAYPAKWDLFAHDVFAAWFLRRSSLAYRWRPPIPLDPGDSWEMGRTVGAAAAGVTEAQAALDALEPEERAAALALVDRLAAIDEPQAVAAGLVEHRPCPCTQFG
jgi:hypothetical protein